MTNRKQTKTIAQKEAERREKEAKDQKTTDPGKSLRTPKPKKIITKAVAQARQKTKAELEKAKELR